MKNTEGFPAIKLTPNELRRLIHSYTEPAVLTHQSLHTAKRLKELTDVYLETMTVIYGHKKSLPDPETFFGKEDEQATLEKERDLLRTFGLD